MLIFMKESDTVIAIIIILSVLLIALMYCVVFGFIAFDRSFTRKVYEGDQIEAAAKKVGTRPYHEYFRRGIYWFKDFKGKEEVWIKSKDGLNLKGYYLENEKSSGQVMILCHGYRSFPYFDFSASAKFYYEEGFDLLFIVQRTHGESEGKYITFGLNERYDLVEWIKYVDNRHTGNAKILLAGVSMGASTVMYALGLDLPESVKGAVCDCGFDTPKHVIGFALTDVFKSKLLASFMSNFVSLVAHFKIGSFLGKVNTAKSLQHNKLPVMFAHGEADDVVPFEMFEKNTSTGNFEKILVTSKDAAHGLVFYYENDKYVKAFRKLREVSGID
ncbi:MAG: alpha/beta hydrolase [Clostridia bacterium]|nr:alpha/beta hydrolase [Clostridia bacterium]